MFKNACILLQLFVKALRPRRRQSVTGVKEHYANEHYDWVTDPKFPEKALHDRRERAMLTKSGQYIANSKVLDVGCGTGLITRNLPGTVTGLDISPWKLKKVRQHAPWAALVLGDAESLPFKNDSFDAVVCTDVLEHLERPDLAVSDAMRVARVLLGTVPSKHLIWRFRRFLTTSDYGTEPFHTYYDERMLRSLLRDYDVKEITKQCLGLELFFAVRRP